MKYKMRKDDLFSFLNLEKKKSPTSGRLEKLT